jgi:hypothetical protein
MCFFFFLEILAKMTQVSDVAPGPLVSENNSFAIGNQGSLNISEMGSDALPEEPHLLIKLFLLKNIFLEHVNRN